MSEALDSGALARCGLLGAEARQRAQEILDRVARDGIETVRVLVPDQHGILRGKAVVAAALPSVFRSGVRITSTIFLKDTSHRTAFPVWSDSSGNDALQGAADLLLVPDPALFRVLPWSPKSAWLLCDVHFPDGTPLAVSSRQVLRQTEARLQTENLAATIGLEVEVQIFRVTDPALSHGDTTMPARPPETEAIAPGYQFLTETVYAQAEPVLDRLRRAALGLGLPLRTVEVEMGPGQFEFTFDPADPMAQADSMVMFRTMAKEICARDGLHATFMGRPAVENAAASGWHVHQSVTRNGSNIFAGGAAAPTPGEAPELTPDAAGWIAGLLDHALATSLMVAPTVNSYKRYRPYQLAPTQVAWGRDNRGAMIRALLEQGDPASRIENRAPDSAANPYYAIAAQLASGLDGMKRGLAPPAATETPYDGNADPLPRDLGEALAAFEASAFVREAFGAEFTDYLSRLKRAEWRRYLDTVSAWEQAEYFRLF